MATVTRRDLARALKEKSGGSITEHDRWIQDFVDILSSQISQSGRVEIRGFGSFSLSTIKAHTTVSPTAKVKSGEARPKRSVPETYSVDFRPSKLYKERLKQDHAPKPKAKKKSKGRSAG
jgi:nucleoid DNA-binding protein